MMIEPLYLLSWAIFFVASLAVLSGAVIVYKQGKNKGLYITFSGIIGLTISALIMTLACSIP